MIDGQELLDRLEQLFDESACSDFGPRLQLRRYPRASAG